MSPCTNDHRNGWSSSFFNIPSKYFESPVVFRQISVDLNITTKIYRQDFKCFSQESPRKMHGEKEPRKIIPTRTSMTWGIPKVSGSCLGSQCGFTTNAGSGDTGTQGNGDGKESDDREIGGTKLLHVGAIANCRSRK